MASKVPLRGLRIEDDLYNKVCYLAKMENRSFNQEATWIIMRFVADYEQKHGPIPSTVPVQDEQA